MEIKVAWQIHICKPNMLRMLEICVLTWVDHQETDVLAVGAGGDGELRPAIDMGVTFLTGSGSPWLADEETTAVAVDTVVWYPSCPAAISPSPSASELSE